MKQQRVALAALFVAAIAGLASLGNLFHKPTRTVIERTIVKESPPKTVTVTVTVPGGEKVTLQKTPSGYRVVTTRSSTTLVASGTTRTTQATSTTQPTSVPPCTAPASQLCGVTP